MDSGIQFVLGGLIGFIGFICCLTVAGLPLGLVLMGVGALVAFSRGN
jgi:hypothetical protein